MEYIFSAVMLGAGYYTFSYGIYLWTKDKNRLGGAGAAAIAVIGALVPIAVLFMKR